MVRAGAQGSGAAGQGVRGGSPGWAGRVLAVLCHPLIPSHCSRGSTQPGQHPTGTAPSWGSTLSAPGPCGTKRSAGSPSPAKSLSCQLLAGLCWGQDKVSWDQGVLSAGPCACKHLRRRRWSCCLPLLAAGLLLPSPVGPHYTTSALPAAAAALHTAGLLGLFGGSRGCAGH